MTSSEFKKMEAAFQRALSFEGADRAAFLAELAENQPDLARDVRQLLKADATGDTIAAPIAASVKALAEEADDPWLGETVGDWRIIARIGAGGMGAVFLAERAGDDYAQQVAVKIMGAQLLDQNASIRFRAERQILANLNHPNIASLIDGGSTDDGLPYLVMEYVDGVRIDDYCDAQNLPVRERLALFQKLCAAVDYAHRNLVVHRDLKPSNMLVTENGEPQLLDFGIAKLLESDDRELTMARTGDGARVMTPEYASPEQVRGEPISVATDIYALGVLLFRLLTGHSPYGPSATSPREIESAILDTEPKKPSASITEYARANDTERTDTLTELGDKRSASPERLRKTLSGDLDTIILKCLQKSPERRYATARELSADIERHLDNRPIVARADSWTYKSKKFLIRNARPVAAAAVVLLTIVALVSFYTLRLSDERDKAQLAAAEAEEISNFLQSIFENASPAIAKGDVITATDLLDEGRQRVDAISGQDSLKAKLFLIMGESYSQLGSYDTAIELITDAIEILEKQSTGMSSELAQAIFDLAEVERLNGNYESSISRHEQSIKNYTSVYGRQNLETAFVIIRTGVAYGSVNRCDEERQHFDDARAILASLPNPDQSYELEILGNLAVCYARLGRNEEALEIGRQAIVKSEELNGLLDPDTIRRRYNYAVSLRREWRLEEALIEVETAIDRGSKTWPAYNPTRLLHLTGYAINLELIGKFDEALAVREQILQISRETHGDDSDDVAKGILGLAVWKKDRGFLAQAADEFPRAISIFEEKSGAESFWTLLTYLFLGETYLKLGEHDRAAAAMQPVMANIGSLHASARRTAKIHYSKILLANGDSEGAISLMDELIKANDGDGSQRGPNTVSLFSDFAAFYRKAGMLEIAHNYAERAHRSGQEGLPAGNWVAALATAEYAYTLAALGKTDDAKNLAADAHANLAAIFGPDDYRIIPLKALIAGN